jgi:hypothetical protein
VPNTDLNYKLLALTTLYLTKTLSYDMETYREISP